jgi:hypothetical protein
LILVQKFIHLLRRVTAMPVNRKIDRSRTTTTSRPSVLELAPNDDDEDDMPLSDLKKRANDASKKSAAKAAPKSRKPTNKKQVVKPKAKKTTTATKKKLPDEEDSFDSANDQISDDADVEDDDHSSDEDFAGDDSDAGGSESDEMSVPPQKCSSRATTTATRTPSRSSTVARTQRNKRRIAKHESSSDDDFVATPAAASKSRSSPRSAKGKSWDVQETLFGSSDEEEMAQFSASRRSRTTTKTTQKPSTSNAKKSRRRRSIRNSSDDSSDDDNAEETHCSPTTRGTPSRASAVKASRKLAATAMIDLDNGEEATFPKGKRRSEAKKDSGEEDFVLEGEDDASDDNLLPDSGAESEDAIGVADDSSDDEPKAVGIVKEGDIGVADDSSSDGEPAHISPKLRLKSSRVPDLFGDDSDSSDADKNPKCPSTNDVITDEDLPEQHVCFFPPDGQSRQCFSLETLRKIALTTAHPCFRANVTGSGKQTFLQPPHFRTAMSDDLLDQIASRFGRDALDLHGAYYHRKEAGLLAHELWPAHEATGTALEDDETFIEQLERYIRNGMGHQDVYCCPLCYIVAHKQLHGKPSDAESDDAEDDDRKERYPTDFLHDPMTVLGFLDNDGFRIASTFCFRKVSLLKEHLRGDHFVDTKMVQGNEAYVRYKVRVCGKVKAFVTMLTPCRQIRAQDGLLQRFLNKCYGTTRQGAMLKYWFHGNNHSFLLLLSLISHASLCRDIVKGVVRQSDKEAVEMAEEFLQPAVDFFESFAGEALGIWDLVASPFSKASKEEIRDFLADDEVEEIDTLASHRALQMQAELEEFQNEQDDDRQLAEYYERLEKENDELASDEGEEDAVGDGGEEDAASRDEDDDQADDASKGSEDDVANGGYFEESSEEEEDDWQKEIMSKRVAKRKSQSPRKRSSRGVSLSDTKPSPKRRAALDASSSKSTDEDVIVPPASVVRKRLVIQDSEDED